MRVVGALFLVLMTFGCSPPEREGSNEAVTNDYVAGAYAGKTKSMISQYTITEGNFRGIRIGMAKQETARALYNIDVHVVLPTIMSQIVVERSEDLVLLREAEGVMWYPGRLRFEFRGDRVHTSEISPRVPSVLSQRLRDATTRDEVFDVLAAILDANVGEKVGSFAPGARWVNLEDMAAADRQLLSDHDAWEFNHSDQTGFWHLRLEFKLDILEAIIVQHSPVELF